MTSRPTDQKTDKLILTGRLADQQTGRPKQDWHTGIFYIYQ